MLQGILVNLTFYQNLDELNILADAMKKNLASATQPISSIVVATQKFLIRCVITLLI